MSILTFLIVMIVSFLYIRFVGGNIRGLAGGLRPWNRSRHRSRSATAGAGPDQDAQEAAQGAVVEWIAVVAILLFCLFPFYWLVNISLKTGARAVGRRTSSRRTRR